MKIEESGRGLSTEVILGLAGGLHSRPAARLAQKAREFSASILLIGENGEVDAKSMLDVLSLACQANDRLTLLASGPDAREALEALAPILSGNGV